MVSRRERQKLPKKLRSVASVVYERGTDTLQLAFSSQKPVRRINFGRKGIVFLYDEEGKLAGIQLNNARTNGFCVENVFLNIDTVAAMKHVDHLWLRRQAQRGEVTRIKAGREVLTTIRWVKNLMKRKKVKAA